MEIVRPIPCLTPLLPNASPHLSIMPPTHPSTTSKIKRNSLTRHADLTVSPRLATSHSEPAFAPTINLDLLNGTGIYDDLFVLRARCSNCRVWTAGFLDASSTQHPMTFAFGPATRLQSNDKAAPLKRHARYGTFTMDMVAATGAGAGVPLPEGQLKGVQAGRLVKDGDAKDRAHAVVGCVALFVLWPVNVVLAGFFKNIRIHVGFSVGIMGFLVVAFGLGIATSGQYIRVSFCFALSSFLFPLLPSPPTPSSSHPSWYSTNTTQSQTYTSPHQILAFLSLAPLLLLSLLPTPPLKSLLPTLSPKLHTPLTSLTFTLLVLSAGLGLRLGAQPTPIIIAYAAVALLVTTFIALVTLCVRRRGSAYARATTRRRLGEEDESDFARAKWGVRKKLSGGSWSGEEGRREHGHGHGQRFGHERSASAGSWREAVGGGTMPGPQYLMNMHPGVPVYVK